MLSRLIIIIILYYITIYYILYYTIKIVVVVIVVSNLQFTRGSAEVITNIKEHHRHINTSIRVSVKITHGKTTTMENTVLV